MVISSSSNFYQGGGGNFSPTNEYAKQDSFHTPNNPHPVGMLIQNRPNAAAIRDA